MSQDYPSNYCGECPIWLAFDEPEGIPAKDAIEKYCSKCDLYLGIDCDGRCLNCDYFNEHGCTIKEF